MLITPMDLQDKPIQRKPKNNLEDFQYSSKLRSAFIAFFLFMIFSNNVSYKILELIMSTFSNVNITNDGCPNFLGIFIMASIVGVIIFIF